MYRRPWLIVMWGIVLTSIAAGNPAEARLPRYMVQLPKRGEIGSARAYDTLTHRLLWSLPNVWQVESASWSRNKRCYALVWSDTNTKKFTRCFTVWYVGRPPRTFAGLPDPMERYHDPPLATDYVLQMTWSPDNRALLLRTAWDGGSEDLGWGPLWCVNLQRRKVRLLDKHLVTAARWISPTKIAYTFSVNGDYTSAVRNKVVHINP